MSITRRTLALLFGVCGAGTLTYLAVTGQADALLALTSSVGMILGFYFGTQSAP